MAYVAKRVKNDIETSETRNENQQLRLQMSEQTDEIAHLKSVLSVMANPYSVHQEFYSQCQRLHEQPADYTVSFQMLASQISASRRNMPSKPEPRRMHNPYQPQQPQHMYEPDPREALWNGDPKRQKMMPPQNHNNNNNNSMPDRSADKWRRVESAFDSVTVPNPMQPAPRGPGELESTPAADAISALLFAAAQSDK